MLTVNSFNGLNVNSNQNFGFKVQIKENSKLVSMSDSYLFKHIPKIEIDAFESKAAEVLPDRNVVLEHKVRRPKPFESFDVDFYTDGKKTDYIVDYDSHAVLTYLKRATNKLSKVHSYLFYGGEQSPEMVARTAKFRETNTRVLNKYRK